MSKEYDGKDLVPGKDGLPVREVGAWSKQKHYYLKRYIDIFTQGMKRKWPGLGYLDIFCGPGKCKIRSSDEEIDGSPLIAANTGRSFDSFVFADMSIDAIDTLEKRFKPKKQDAEVAYFSGNDSNDIADKIVAKMPTNFLHLAFLDPTGLHLDFNTVRKITRARNVDLIISVMDRVDMLRNISAYYYPNQDRNSNLDKFLGDGIDWRTAYDRLHNQDATHVGEMFLELYQQQLKGIGYSHFGDLKRVYMNGVSPLYLLFFASKHALGVDFWNKISAKDFTGQRSFYFSD